MMTRLLVFLVLFAGSATAQSFWPNLAGARYCELRKLGISREEAVTVAMRENWRPDEQPIMVEYNGKPVALPVLDMARWIKRCDPQ